MRILTFRDPNFVADSSFLNRRAVTNENLRETVDAIVEAVREHGDEALATYAEKFDGVTPGQFRVVVSREEIAATSARVGEEVKSAILASRDNVRAFAERGLRRDWHGHNAQGAEVGEVYHPFQRVGIYVPGGTAPLVSTVVMTVTLAAAAGVPEIVVCTPPQANGGVNDALLCALELCGATEVYRAGGAQAIAALAHGTKTIKPVAKVFGPGNRFMVEAKRQCFGIVSVDLLPGPSEVLVLADGSANPDYIAADLLAQAEHGGDSVVGLITDTSELIESVQKSIVEQASHLSRQGPLRKVIEDNLFLVLVETLEDGAKLVNDFAPEHLSLIVRRESDILPLIRTAGAIFIGNDSPVAAGDFLAGPSHELPTGGAGKSFPGLTVDQFQRRTSLVRLDKNSLRASASILETFARIEGLDAHGHSISVRL